VSGAGAGRQVRVRAPEPRGRRWLNTGGRDVTLAGLRGRIVLLDFWTFCCVNCLHVLDELRHLEEKYGDVLVTIGVHSPKFEHEKDPDAVAAAVERYGVAHPVLDDPELHTWQQYAARAWPTLAVVDPEGYVVATMAGEGHAEGLDRLIAHLIGEHGAKGTLRRGDGPYVPAEAPPGELRFPGKAIVLPADRHRPAAPGAGPAAAGDTLLVSDSAHHRLVELAADGETVLRTIGSGRRGRRDGATDQADLNEPQGLALLPADVAERVGYDVVVADTVNHLLRGVRLADGTVTTVAGTGRPWRSEVDHHPHDALSADLSSPWDVAWYEDAVVVAMAGIHQLWRFDPLRRTVVVFAGTTTESLRDGEVSQAFLAQPSGLAAAGDRLWVLDSETSALRHVERGELSTVVGQGLFDFGHVDGPAAGALLQHPLGLAVLDDGSVAVADTYNGAIRRYDPVADEVSTLATDLAEPTDVLLVGGELVVVESGAHRLVRPLLSGRLDELTGSVGRADRRYRTERPATPLAAGEVTLEVVYTPPPGTKLDDSFGPPTRLEVSADPPELLVGGAGVGTDLTRRLVLSAGVPAGVLQVSAQAASCDADVPNPACRFTRQDWGVPVTLDPAAPATLTLLLSGIAAE
jgi:thiol-disulfide isomerase/thioredoxin